MDPAAAFAELMAGPDPALDRALALVAATGRPAVDPDRILADLDDLAARCPAGDAPGLCRWLFGDEGFAGDRTDYYDPDNSRLDRVLERRRGIPISLAAIGIETGRRVGIDLVGIGMPGHFLLRDAAGAAYFDAFDGGRALDPPGCRDLFVALHGPGAGWDDGLLAPVGTREIVTRVLNNLRVATVRAEDRAGLTAALRLQVALPGSGPAERGQLANALVADGRFGEAAAVLEDLAALDPGRQADHLAAATRLRARLN